MSRIKTAIFISGSGSNLQALIDAAAAPNYPAAISLVIANRSDAYGLTRARKAGIKAVCIDHTTFDSRVAFERALQAQLQAACIDIICLAGFMRVLTEEFTAKWAGRILNVHPSLLPAFRGLHAHQQALDAGVKISGCTVHVVTASLDAGPIIGQAAVPVETGDTPKSLASRILAEEHRLYPDCLARFARTFHDGLTD